MDSRQRHAGMTEDGRRMENCVLCPVSKIEVMIPASVLPDRVNVLRCANCGLVYLDSRGSGSRTDAEEAVYWDKDEQKEIYLDDSVKELFATEFKRHLEALRCFLPNKGKLLDVGCGVGHFLDVAQKQGWKAEGLDISDSASKIARETYGLDVHVGTLDGIQFQHANYDAKTMWDVIEHIKQPVENMAAANRLLRKGGILVMKTPNERSFFKSVARGLYRVFGQRAVFLLKYVYYVPHYFSYSRKTMEMLLIRAGFEMVRYEEDTTPRDFAAGKINIHYKKDPKRNFVIMVLPVMSFLSKLFRRENKMIVYARKVREV